MAKKSRRSRRKARRAPVARDSTRQQPEARVPRKAATAKVDLAQEYQYVFADLRRIAIIAVIMFALLFALAFVLR
jgi:hypothetical protein